MNNKEYTEEKEEILKNVLINIAKDLAKKEYKQAFRAVKLEFIKDAINDLFNIKNTSDFKSLADLLNDNLKLNQYKLKLFILNGAQSFEAWSFGGCGMVYNDDLREAFKRPNETGEKLLKLQAYCYYKAYCELANLIMIGLLKYEKK